MNEAEQCRWCGSPTPAEGAFFCSETCLRRHSRANSRQRSKDQGRRKSEFPLYVRQHIHGRDDWTCQICGEATSDRYRHGDPLSPTVDHILPVSWTGRPVNALWNLTTAHEVCNRKRGTGFGEGPLARLVRT